MKTTVKKKKLMIYISEEIAERFVKRTKQSGITQSFVAEALLKNWLEKPLNTGTDK